MLRTLTLLFVLALSPPLNAGSFAVSPVRITLDASRTPVTALTVSNHSELATLVQADVLQWQASGNSDEYVPTSELLVTPPLFTLPPHGTQVIRVGLRQRSATAHERTFRLYLTEVPPPPAPNFQGLNVALRLGVPVFVSAVDTAPVLSFELQAQGAQALQVAALNSGNAHIRLGMVELLDGAGSLLAQLRLSRDLLAGQRWQFSLPLSHPLPSGARLQVRMRSDTSTQSFELRTPAG